MTQSDLIPGEPDTISAITNDMKAAYTFGDAATLAGLGGSSGEGWDCPCCSSHRTLKERRDHKGAKCTVCATGFDVIEVVMRGHALSFLDALSKMQEALAALKDNKTGDLFDD